MRNIQQAAVTRLGRREAQACGDDDTIFESAGEFWIDGSSPVTGRLTWNRRGGTLRVASLLRIVDSATRDSADVIYGQTTGGRALVLLDSFVSTTRFPPNPYLQDWTVNGALLDCREANPKPAGLRLELVGPPPFLPAPTPRVERRRSGLRVKTEMRLDDQQHLEVVTADAVLRFDDRWSIENRGGNSVTSHATPRLTVTAAPTTSRASLEDLASRVVALVAVCYGRPIGINREQLLDADGHAIEVLTGRRDIPRLHSPRNPPLLLGNLNPYDRTFTSWLAFCERRPASYRLVAEYLGAVERPWEERLLILVRFIETYHEERFSGAVWGEAEFETRRETVLRGIEDEDMANWIGGLLSHANQKRLAERLRDLIDEHGSQLHGALRTPSDFKRRVVATRNYNTHFSPELRPQAATGMALVVLTKRLWVLVRACVLRECGFAPDEITELLRFDSSELSWLADQPR